MTMLERRGPGRRREDRIVAWVIRGLRLAVKLGSALVAAYSAGVALAITAKSAWIDMWQAFFQR